jgi:hypothetical protein
MPKIIKLKSQNIVGKKKNHPLWIVFLNTMDKYNYLILFSLIRADLP